MDTWNLVEAGSGRTESSLDDVWRGRQTQQLADAHAGGERRQESGPVYDSPGRPYAAVRARLVGGIDVLAEAVRWPDVGDERLTQHAALKQLLQKQRAVCPWPCESPRFWPAVGPQ
jgi:hypothetical protein